MKRLGVIAATLLLFTLFQTAVCFAAGLEIVNSYPRDGGTGLQPVNCAVKIYFNQDVSSADYITANNNCFSITDPENNELPVTVLHDTKDNTMVLVVLNDVLQSDTEYKLTISGEFTASNGAMLEDDRTITFRTRNLKTDTNTSMVMMVVMFAGILFFSSKQMKRQAKKAAEKGGDGKVNPYKVSKETGKPVTEIVKKTEKIRKKKADEEAKKRVQEDVYVADEDEYDDADIWEEENDNIRVRRRRPISEGGSTYRSGKKAKAEAAAKKKAVEEAKRKAMGTTNPKKQSNKSKKKKK